MTTPHWLPCRRCQVLILALSRIWAWYFKGGQTRRPDNGTHTLPRDTQQLCQRSDSPARPGAIPCCNRPQAVDAVDGDCHQSHLRFDCKSNPSYGLPSVGLSDRNETGCACQFVGTSDVSSASQCSNKSATSIGPITKYLQARSATTSIMLLADDFQLEMGGPHFTPAFLVFFQQCNLAAPCHFMLSSDC